jgi:hypothetical protein
LGGGTERDRQTLSVYLLSFMGAGCLATSRAMAKRLPRVILEIASPVSVTSHRARPGGLIATQDETAVRTDPIEIEML